MSSRWPKKHHPSRPDEFVRPGVSGEFWRGLAFAALLYLSSAGAALLLVLWARGS